MAKKKQVQNDNEFTTSEGVTITFVEKLKGKHYLAMQKTIAKSIKTTQKIVDGQVVDDAQTDMGEYSEQVINMFPILVQKIVDKDDKEIKATVDFFMELDYEDAREVYNKVTSLVSQTYLTKKK